MLYSFSMAITYSEMVHFVPNPTNTANLMVSAFGWEIIETFQDSWVLLKTPGEGKIGFMQHEGKEGQPWPHAMAAFRSDQIEADIAQLRTNGLDVSEVKKSADMWHAMYVDPHGNKFMIWQEPQK